MIKSIIHPITGQSFTISNDTPFSVITDIIYFIIRTVKASIDWLGQSLILELHWSYGIDSTSPRMSQKSLPLSITRQCLIN